MPDDVDAGGHVTLVFGTSVGLDVPGLTEAVVGKGAVAGGLGFTAVVGGRVTVGAAVAGIAAVVGAGAVAGIVGEANPAVAKPTMVG